MTKRPTPELIPLVEDASQSPFMRELLEAGRDGGVAGYDFEQGLSKHLALVEAGAPMPHWAEGLRPAAGGAAAAGSSIIGWVAVPLALVALTSAVVLVSRQAPAPVAQGVQVATPSVPVAAPVVAPVPAQQHEPVPQPAATAPRTGHAPLNAAAPRSARAKHAAPASEVKAPPAPAVSAEGNAKAVAKPAASEELFETAQPAAATTAAEASADQAKPDLAPPAAPQAARAKQPSQPTPQDDARLEREMSMLAVAQRALQNDPARSLALARQGESEFAGSMFTQERQQVLLLALVKLGRMDEARRLAKPYLARYPHGPFSDRVRRALATGRVER